MKKRIILLLKGLGLGLAGGLVLAAAALLLYRATHVIPDPDHLQYVDQYFLMVGALLGLLGGWTGSLHVVLWNIIRPVLWKTAGFLPATLGRIDASWINRLRDVMEQVLARTGFVLRVFIGKVFMPRLGLNAELYNEAVEKARKKNPQDVSTPQGLSFVALDTFLRPLWTLFYVAYAVIAAGFVVFLGIPFLK
jgi:hypothetical protein